ncbi:hypothetical protein CY35_02G109100 [Sphagnum magellanicum]|nr:hypothetical protein CY35_02G109100 [Sphagnum magellanicum]
MTVLTTAARLLAMLRESHNPILKLHALHNLNLIVDQFWTEISANLSQIQRLCEDEQYDHRELAALVTSKVFFHLGGLNESLMYALRAGCLFDVSDNTEYAKTLVAKCVDEYISLALRGGAATTTESSSSERQDGIVVDPRLVSVVERTLDKCMADGKFKHAIGLALECHRLDKVEQAIIRSKNVPKMLSYCLRLLQTFVRRKEFRHEVLRLLVKNYESLQQPDYLSICQCCMFLDDPQTVASILGKLLRGGDKTDVLVAYQVAFDLFENENRKFLLSVRDRLPETSNSAQQLVSNSVNNAATAAPPPRSAHVIIMSGGSEHGATAIEAEMIRTEEEAPKQESHRGKGLAAINRSTYAQRLKKIKGIFSGDTPINLTLQFLCTHNRATNWAKFSATAGLGVIHRGHLQKAKAVLSPYLPQQGGAGGGGSSFPQGGALYALGLIHANHGEGIRQYLLDSLRNTGNEVIQHGACLGLGLAAIGTGDEEIIEELKAVLYNDSAIAGEAAGISMGLVMVGTPSDKAGEMLTYAHNTQHEKIARGLALGVALMLYGCEEEADPVIDQMTRDPDPVLRYGGMYAMAMAYRGTANNTTIRRLLHFAVSDVNDDVQRTAVLALGFVLCSEPEQTPRIVSLLVESYNPHVRYGAAMAIGISCASSGSNKAISLLEPLMTDKVDFVRQGALLGMSMVLLQTTEAREPRLCRFRKQVEATISNKQEETMTKMGAILAQGILNAGGCNVGIMLRSRTGHDRMNAIVGMAVFSQFWFWYPLIHFLSLTFSTMAFIGLNEDLCMPKFEFVSDAKPAMFGSSPPVATPVVSTASKIKVPAQVLSTSSRVKSQGIPMMKVSKSKAGKTILQEDGCLDLPSNSKRPKICSSPINEPEQPTAAKEEEAMDRKSQHEVRDHQPTAKDEEEFRVTVREKGAPVTQKTQSLEKLTEVLSNPTRIIPAQEKFLRFQEGCRYAPLKLRQGLLGFVMLNDLAPSEPVELVTTDAAIFTTTPPITSSAAGLFAETSRSL